MQRKGRSFLKKRKPILPLFPFPSKFYIANLKDVLKGYREKNVEVKLQGKQHC